MAIEITDATRNDIAKALFNSITLLAHWGQPTLPEVIEAQIRECNSALRKIGCAAMVDDMPERRRMLPQSILAELEATPSKEKGWHLLGHPHDGCPCSECIGRDWS